MGRPDWAEEAPLLPSGLCPSCQTGATPSESAGRPRIDFPAGWQLALSRSTTYLPSGLTLTSTFFLPISCAGEAPSGTFICESTGSDSSDFRTMSFPSKRQRRSEAARPTGVVCAAAAHLDHFAHVGAGLLQQLQLLAQHAHCSRRTVGGSKRNEVCCHQALLPAPPASHHRHPSPATAGQLTLLQATSARKAPPPRTFVVQLVALGLHTPQVVLLVADGYLQLLDLALVVRPQTLSGCFPHGCGLLL